MPRRRRSCARSGPRLRSRRADRRAGGLAGPAVTAAPAGPGPLICAPNGACFVREPGILPELLDRFFASRAAARQRGDEVASYVYKIIMNSFYGVLGAAGCRFAGSALAGAVTSFGQHLLGWCRDLLERHGLRVLYGDTDSLFVTPARASLTADEVLRLVNTEVARFCKSHYGVVSHLELELDRPYSHFFLPRVRGGPNARGRAKGYAGRIGSGPDEGRIEVKGMEAARTDWTPLARRLEVPCSSCSLRARAPRRRASSSRASVAGMRAGRLDAELVYRKRLRKPVADYTASQPPHVRAAQLGGDEPGSFVSYVMTGRGPEPADRPADQQGAWTTTTTSSTSSSPSPRSSSKPSTPISTGCLTESASCGSSLRARVESR